MHHSTARLSLSCAIILILGGCSKKPDEVAAPKPASVNLVQDSERSPHFAAVDSHLELGGTLYGYADVDGDVAELVTPVQMAMRQIAETQPQMAMFAKQDFKALFTSLGLDDIKAIGLSSVHQADGLYRNRAFMYTPQGRHGLLAVFGGDPGPFVNASMAPADADLYTEFDFDVKAIYETTESIIAKVNGPQAAADFREQVRNVGKASHFSLLDLFEGLHGRATYIVKLDPVKNFTMPAPVSVTFPIISMLVKIDGVGPAVESMLEAKPEGFDISTIGTMKVYALKAKPPFEGFELVLAFDGNAFFLATSKSFLAESLTRKDGLDKNPAFASGLAALGPNGNGISWVSPTLMKRLKELGAMNAKAPAATLKFLDMYASNLPEISQPLMSVRTNLPDGILMRSMWNRSLKSDLVMLSVYNPVTIGFLAAIAIPSLQKVRQNAQLNSVQANLGMLSAASERFCAEHGASSCTYADLVGADKPLKAVTPVMGEDYSHINFYKGLPVRLRLPNGQVAVFYPPSARRPKYNQVPTPDPNGAGMAKPAPFTPSDGNATPFANRAAIKANLAKLSEAADDYYLKTGATSVTYEDLVGPGKAIQEIQSVAGENYRTVLFVKGKALHIVPPDGISITYYPP
jgi:type II secretory pathway pseudopilin PulG